MYLFPKHTVLKLQIYENCTSKRVDSTIQWYFEKCSFNANDFINVSENRKDGLKNFLDR